MNRRMDSLPYACGAVLPLFQILFVFAGLHLILLASAGISGEPVRVMSYNIRYGTAADGENHWNLRKENLAALIERFGPDLLGTQETLADQHDFLQERLPGYESYGVGREDGVRKGEMASVFWKSDRWRCVDRGTFWLSETPDQVASRGWDAALPRVATWVLLREVHREDAADVLWINVHFDHRGAKARLESARLLTRWALERSRLSPSQGCDVLVTGDFNAGEDSDPYQSLFVQDASAGKPSFLRDAFRAVHSQRGDHEGTFSGFDLANSNGERIDWIAVSSNWKVLESSIYRTADSEGRTPSDHFPVTAIMAR
ncbi:MAG: endonuclease/exonuclease/phosphatase family protein [Pirellulaceae bacterium]